MKAWMAASVAALVAGALLSSGTAFAQAKPDCPQGSPSASPGVKAKAGAPERIEGQVTKVDPKSSKITVKASDGTNHEFTAPKEAIGDYKVGDRIEAKLRASDC